MEKELLEFNFWYCAL